MDGDFKVALLSPMEVAGGKSWPDNDGDAALEERETEN